MKHHTRTSLLEPANFYSDESYSRAVKTALENSSDEGPKVADISSAIEAMANSPENRQKIRSKDLDVITLECYGMRSDNSAVYEVWHGFSPSLITMMLANSLDKMDSYGFVPIDEFWSSHYSWSMRLPVIHIGDITPDEQGYVRTHPPISGPYILWSDVGYLNDFSDEDVRDFPGHELFIDATCLESLEHFSGSEESSPDGSDRSSPSYVESESERDYRKAVEAAAHSEASIQFSQSFLMESDTFRMQTGSLQAAKSMIEILAEENGAGMMSVTPPPPMLRYFDIFRGMPKARLLRIEDGGYIGGYIPEIHSGGRFLALNSETSK